MKKQSEEILLEYPEKFFKDRYGNIYPYFKEDIKNEINPFEPNSFIWILQEMDYPYIKVEWLKYISSASNNSVKLKNIISKYIACMNLCGWKGYTFKDSEWINKQYKFDNFK